VVLLISCVSACRSICIFDACLRLLLSSELGVMITDLVYCTYFFFGIVSGTLEEDSSSGTTSISLARV
jgi:hypothetical protein